jgi:hypothetical protein
MERWETSMASDRGTLLWSDQGTKMTRWRLFDQHLHLFRCGAEAFTLSRSRIFGEEISHNSALHANATLFLGRLKAVLRVRARTKMEPTAYFRRDREEGITPPDLTKSCSVAEHIGRARGKRTNFTSVSLDLSRLRDLGEAEYQLRRPETETDGHGVIEHNTLVQMLRQICQTSDKHERARALQGIRYARARLEGSR